MPPSYNTNSTDSGSATTNNINCNTSSNKQSTNNNEEDNVFEQELREMHQAVPTATHAECQRFLADRNGNTKTAIDKLRCYIEWRNKYCNDELSHLDSWTYASQLALQSANAANKKGNVVDSTTFKLPCTFFMMEEGAKKYLHHFPARIDTKLADTSTYALALALYIDHVLDRNTTEKATLIIDVRPGYGWANINAIHLLPFIQSVSRLLCDLFPSRLEQCIVYPVPKVATFLWKAIRPFVGTETVDKICLVTGPAGKKDKVPKKVCNYLDKKLITKLEEKRTSCFS